MSPNMSAESKIETRASCSGTIRPLKYTCARPRMSRGGRIMVPEHGAEPKDRDQAEQPKAGQRPVAEMEQSPRTVRYLAAASTPLFTSVAVAVSAMVL